MRPKHVLSLTILCCALTLTGCGAPSLKMDMPELPNMSCPREPDYPGDNAPDRTLVSYFENVRLAGAECRDKADAGEAVRQRNISQGE